MATNSINLFLLNGSNGFRMDGANYVSQAEGDINGDGFDDAIIGSPFGSSGHTYASGHTYVLFGKASGFNATLDLLTLDGNNGFRLDGAEYDQSGYSVSAAGDVNGDGFDDVIVSPGYVVFGKVSGFNATLDLSNLDGSNGFRLVGGGSSVSTAGDVNGDGFDDVIVDASYVVFGKASGFNATLDLSSLDGSNGFRLGASAGTGIGGYEVSTAGDVNGDGFDDVIIGSLGANPHGSISGSSYVVFGKETGFNALLDLSSLDGSDGFRLDGGMRLDRSGASVGTAGDVNGDGFDDVIVGAPWADGNYPFSDAGISYVVFGKASGFSAAMDLSSLNGSNGFRLEGKGFHDFSGFSVNTAGDVNGDGFADVIVGALGADYNGTDSGSSYVVFGKASGFSAVLDLSSLDGSNGFRLDGAGRWVSSAGDVNDDGFDDVIVGSGGSFSYVVFGRSSFTDYADFQGTPGDDNFIGTKAAERFKGEAGNDRMIGRGGADSFDGGSGNDYIRISGANFEFVDGGTGTDTLGLAGSNFNLDLSSVIEKIHGIETIGLYGVGDNSLTVTAQDVINLSGSTNTLKVKGDAGDSVVGLSSGWTDGGVHGNFHTYTQDEAVLLVGVNVTTDFA